MCRNPRRDVPRPTPLFTLPIHGRGRRRRAPFLVQLVALLIETLENFERLAALIHPAEPPVHAREDVVVGGRARVEGDGVVEGIDGLVQPSLALVRPGLLEKGAIRLRLQRKRFARLFERRIRPITADDLATIEPEEILASRVLKAPPPAVEAAA